MNKNKILIIVIIIIFVIIFIIIKSKNKHVNLNETKNNTIVSEIKSNYNNETGMYEIVDEITGEVISETISEEEMNLQLKFYKENPDYRAEPPIFPSAENFVL